MKRLSVFFFVLFCAVCLINASGAYGGTKLINLGSKPLIEEADGDPSTRPYKIVFPSGTLTCAAGVCTYAPSATSATFTDFYLAGPDVTHGMTSIAPTADYLAAFQIGSSGGADIYGMTEADQAGALRLTGIIGSTDPTDIYPAVIFRGGKKNGTGWQALGAAETVLMFYNYTTSIGQAYGNGEWIFNSIQGTPIGSTTASTGTFSSLELVKTDAITDCSGFTATGGGLFYDDSEGKFKKCQDNVLTDMDTASAGYTNLTEFVGQTAWRVFYSDGSGDVKELALGTDGQYLKSNGATSAPTFDTPAAAHDAVTLNANITPTELLTLTGQDIALATQTANYGLFGPTSGAAAAPGFRAMVNADIPTTLTPQVTRIGVGQAADGTNLIASSGFSVDPDGDVVVKSLTVTRVAGSASASDYYEVPANGDSKVTVKAPDSLAADYVATLPSATGTLAVTSGALGTPSFTALNLPSANADPGTTAGQISHDSTDTASSSGGTLKWYDGAQVRSVVDTGTNYTKITKYEYMPIRYAEDDDSVTAPAAAAEINTSSTMIGRSFAEDADNGVVFWWQVPSDYVSGIKYRVYYAMDTNASADETVAFGMSGCSVGNSDAIACSEGTAVNVTDELSTDEDVGELIVTGWSTEVTVTNAAAGELAKLLFIRDVSEDDAAGHTLVTGIEIKYVGKISPFGDY